MDLPFGDWQATALFNYGRSNTLGFQRSLNTAFLSQSLRQTTVAGVLTPALVAAPGLAGNAIDPYNLNLGNPQVINQVVDFGQLGKAIQHQLQYGASANGTLFELPGGSVKASLGVQREFYDYVANWNTAWPVGAIAGAPVAGSQVAVARPHRITNSGFGEINVPDCRRGQ